MQPNANTGAGRGIAVTAGVTASYIAADVVSASQFTSCSAT
jgi:hypothetical protein